MLDWAAKIAGKGKRRQNADARTPEMQGGLVAGTMIATTCGWVPVEQICVGDEVMTFDDGIQEVAGLTRRLHPMTSATPAGASGVRPLLSIPGELIGNRRPMLLPEGQAMLVESDFAEAYLGDPFAALDSAELVGLPGARKVLPEDRVIVVTLAFAEDQMVFVEGHALAYCPAARIGAPMSVDEAIWPEDGLRYQVLSHDDAEVVVAGMASGEDVPSTPQAVAQGAPVT